jgi:hypothetical protein
MQFMSESMGWSDNFILAMAPLGIITAVIGAIRVGGPIWIRAIVGRARENLVTAEAELMSSTSNELCELWNGSNVVRCMGSGAVTEFIHVLPKAAIEKGADMTNFKTMELESGSPKTTTGKDAKMGDIEAKVETSSCLKKRGDWFYQLGFDIYPSSA